MMNTAFEILGVSEQADDKAIKSAYLQQVKRYPPEQAPKQFSEIHQAYELIQDAPKRAHYQLFYRPEADFNVLLAKAFETEAVTSIDGKAIFALMQSSVHR